MIHKTLINSDLSDVKIYGGYIVKKDNWSRYHLALKKLLKKSELVEDVTVISDDVSKCLDIIESAKDEKPIPFSDTLTISETLCYALGLFDGVIQEWSEQETDPVAIREATQFRQILVFMLYEICVFQTKVIYQTFAA